jgi:hypothetical protein
MYTAYFMSSVAYKFQSSVLIKDHHYNYIVSQLGYYNSLFGMSYVKRLEPPSSLVVGFLKLIHPVIPKFYLEKKTRCQLKRFEQPILEIIGSVRSSRKMFCDWLIMTMTKE